MKNEVKKEVKKELKTTIKKQKGLKTEKKTVKALDREGKISVNIRTADGLPLKKFIDENSKLKEAMKSILDSDGNSLFIKCSMSVRIVQVIFFLLILTSLHWISFLFYAS